jgi:hypothetical protein
MVIEQPLPPVVSNIFMQHFDTLALDTANHKSSLYLQYVHNKFVTLPHGPQAMQEFSDHINNPRPSI